MRAAILSFTLAVIAGCGRFGFDAISVDDSLDDATPASDAIDDANGSGDGATDASGDPSGWVAFSPAPPTTNTLWAVEAIGAELHIAGVAGTIARYNGTWTSGTSAATDTLFNFHAVDGGLWLGGRNCAVLRSATPDQWTQGTITGCTDHVFSVGGVASSDIWAVGVNGLVARWNGNAWSTSAQGMNTDFWSVFAVAANNVYLAGTRGTILQWNGSTYNDVAPTLPNVTVAALWGPGTGELWAVGEGGLIAHMPAGGAWSQVASPTTMFLYDVAGTSATDIWAVGSAGTLLHYDGQTWQAVPSPTPMTLRNVDFAPSGDGYIVGDSAVVLHRAP